LEKNEVVVAVVKFVILNVLLFSHGSFAQFARDLDPARAAEYKEFKEGPPPIIERTTPPQLIGKDLSEKSEEDFMAEVKKDPLTDPDPMELEVTDKKDRKWKVIVWFGFTAANYRSTDVRIKSDIQNTDVVVKDIQPQWRSSVGAYKVWDRPAKDMFRWLDEPTNTGVFVVQTGRHEFGIQIHHPKYVMLSKDHQKYKATGVIEGVPVNDEDIYMRMPEGTGEFEKVPGFYFVRYENSHLALFTSVRYAYIVPIVKFKNGGSINLSLGGNVGVYTGFSNQVLFNRENKHECLYCWVTNPPKTLGYMGYGGGLIQRLAWSTPRSGFNLFVERRDEIGKMSYGMVGNHSGEVGIEGTISHKIRSTQYSFGIGISMFQFGKKKGM